MGIFSTYTLISAKESNTNIRRTENSYNTIIQNIWNYEWKRKIASYLRFKDKSSLKLHISQYYCYQIHTNTEQYFSSVWNLIKNDKKICKAFLWKWQIPKRSPLFHRSDMPISVGWEQSCQQTLLMMLHDDSCPYLAR